jgi:hypothetical protein
MAYYLALAEVERIPNSELRSRLVDALDALQDINDIGVYIQAMMLSVLSPK